MSTEVERLRVELLQERAWREELQGLTIVQAMEVERLKSALEELESESRRPFATIERISFLARRALDI